MVFLLSLQGILGHFGVPAWPNRHQGSQDPTNTLEALWGSWMGRLHHPAAPSHQRPNPNTHPAFHRKPILTQICPSSLLRTGIKIIIPNDHFNLIWSSICLNNLGDKEGCWAFWSGLKTNLIMQTSFFANPFFVNPFASHTWNYFWCLWWSITNQITHVNTLWFNRF